MSVKVIHRNYRVVVGLRNPGDYGFMRLSGQTRTEAEEKQIATHLANLIKRHLSPSEDDRGDVSVECDTDSVCTFCGSDWTEKTPDYNGGCCSRDEDSNPDKDANP